MRVRYGSISLKRRVPGLPRNRLREFLKVVNRGCAFGLQQRLVYRLYIAQAVNLEADGLQKRHLCESSHLVAVAHDAVVDRVARRRLLVTRFASRKNQRCRHPLQVPLKGAANRLVEVVDVEDEAAVRRGKGSEVAHVGIAAELRLDPRVRDHREIGCHHRRRTTQIRKRRLCHDLMLQLKEGWHAAAFGALQ